MKFFVILFFAISVWAAQKSDTWELKKEKVVGQAEKVFFIHVPTRKVVSEFEAENDLEDMKAHTVIKLQKKEYFLTIWSHGASGSMMIIFDPTNTKDPAIYVQGTTSTFQYKLRDGGIEVSYFHDKSIDDASQVESKDFFKP